MAVPSPAQPSPLRLLVLAPSSEPTAIPPFPKLLEAITGSKPSEEVTSFSGYTSHPPLALRTKYYSSDVSIWCDELPTAEASGPPVEKHGDSIAGKSAIPAASGVNSLGDLSRTRQADDPQGDEADAPSTLAEWEQQMLSPAAAEVRAVIGGIVLVLPISPRSLTSIPESYYSFIEAVHTLRDAIEDECAGRDIASIVVLQPTSPAVSQETLATAAEELECICLSDRELLGWDFVAWDGVAPTDRGSVDDADARNEYGEKVGIKRVIEVLQGIDWTVAPDFGDTEDAGEFGLDEHDPLAKAILGDRSFFNFDSELQQEMMELKMSMFDTETSQTDEAPNAALSDPVFELDHDLWREAKEANASRPDPNQAQDNKSKRPDEEEETQVELLQGLMERVLAVKEAASEMPKAEKERFARSEIEKIMREMG